MATPGPLATIPDPLHGYSPLLATIPDPETEMIIKK